MTIEAMSEAELEHWMGFALEEAEAAFAEGEVPIGAVAVLGGELIAADHNRSIQLHDPTAHCEVLVLRECGRRLGNYRLNGLVLFTTVEPCAMCAGALIWARISSVVFGTRDEKSGAVSSKAALLEEGLFNHQVDVVEGIRAEESRALLRRFFEDRRGR